MKLKYFSLALLIFTSGALASGTPASVTYQGRILDPSDRPIESTSVTFNLQVVSQGAEECVLYEETHVINMSGSNGIFSLSLGKGAVTAGDPGIGFKSSFNNTASWVALTCASGTTYTPSPTDDRVLRVSFDDGGGPLTIAPDHRIKSVPMAMYAEYLGGIDSTGFLQVSTSGAVDLTQANAESIFSTPNLTELNALIGGTSTQYAKTSDLSVTGGVLDMSGGGVQVANTPGAVDHAVNQYYVDSNIAGSGIDQTGLADGNTLIWNAVASNWEVGTPSATDSSKLALTGGTMSGNIDMGTNNISNVTNLTATNVTAISGSFTDIYLYDNDTNFVKIDTPACMVLHRVWSNPI